jgi:hypothetical protein
MPHRKRAGIIGIQNELHRRFRPEARDPQNAKENEEDHLHPEGLKVSLILKQSQHQTTFEESSLREKHASILPQSGASRAINVTQIYDLSFSHNEELNQRIPSFRSRALQTSPAKCPNEPRGFRAPLWRRFPKYSRLSLKTSLTKVLLPSTAPSAK